jgi:hypothetical protein
VLLSKNDVMAIDMIPTPMKLLHPAEVIGFSSLVSWRPSRMEYFGDDTGLAYDMMNCCGGSWMSYRGTESMVLTVYSNYMACRKCYKLDLVSKAQSNSKPTIPLLSIPSSTWDLRVISINQNTC